MSLDLDKDSSPLISSLDDLTDFFRRGEKPKAAWRVGVEHEKFGFLGTSPEPVPYAGVRSIASVLERFERFGFERYLEEGNAIAGIQKGATLSLEPGGQFELSGAPFHTIHECKEELLHHMAQSVAIGAELGITWVGLGYRPFGTTATAPWMPKIRYGLMKDYMPTRGKLALDMMLMTSTVQANYDYGDEADMVAKMRTAMSISPVISAAFSNSFLVNGKDSGYASFRYAVWNDVDPDRCGLLPFVFDEDFGYERWVQYALDVPMFFIKREGRYIRATHLTFRKYMAEGLDGHRATMGDFEDHLTTLFPEVRLKKVMEVRGTDVGSTEMNVALPAIWKGILYDAGALAAAERVLDGLSFEERLELQNEVARKGLAGTCRKGKVLDLARELFRIGSEGLKAQGALNAAGEDERVLLEPLAEVLESGRTPADVWRERWHGELGRNPSALIRAAAF